MKQLNENEMQRVTLLLEFLKITKGGLTKPFDPTPLLQKIENFERRSSSDLSELKNCCPNQAVIQDAKDFKPYILAALNQFAEVMGLNVNKQFGDG